MDDLSLPLRDRLLWQQAFRALDDNNLEKLQELLNKGAALNAMRPAMVERNGQWFQTKVPETLASCALRHGQFEAWLLLNNHAKRHEQELISDDKSFLDSVLGEVWTQMGKHCLEIRSNLMEHGPQDHPALMCLRECVEEEIKGRTPIPGMMSEGYDPMEQHWPLLEKWHKQCQLFDEREEIKGAVVDRPSSPSKIM